MRPALACPPDPPVNAITSLDIRVGATDGGESLQQLASIAWNEVFWSA
jgi:hypothetical protein